MSDSSNEPPLGHRDLMATQPIWRFRGYLPHCDRQGAMQSITFRLADSLPQEALDRLEWALRIVPPHLLEMERRRRLDQWLDAGTGCCALRHPEVASVVKESLLRFHGDRYELHTWCLMPNHVHVLIEAWASLETIVRSWKSYTGRWALAQNVRLGLASPARCFGCATIGTGSSATMLIWREPWHIFGKIRSRPGSAPVRRNGRGAVALGWARRAPARPHQDWVRRAPARPHR